jgi:hypothetical protein
VEFRLIYRGELPSATRGNGRTEDKHRIRCEFNKQLRVLWSENRILRPWEEPRPDITHIPPGAGLSYTRALKYERCGKLFLPLIDEEHGLACSLDILFLRRDNPGGFIVSGGDIDNRIKTLFDALRVPDKCDELPPNWVPKDDEQPLYCLMEDDKLITKVTVTTDHLILPRQEGEGESAVVLIIHVKTKIVDFQRAYMEFLA